MPAPAFSTVIRKIAHGRGMDARPTGSESNRTMERRFLLNVGAGNGACESRIYFPISSFKAPDTFQIS